MKSQAAHHHPAKDSCCSPASQDLSTPLPTGLLAGQRFRISSMDCSVEESEIRQALEPIAGIQSLGFRLSERTLSILADEAAYPLALAAIRKAGFDPQPLAVPTPAANAEDSHLHEHAGEPGMLRLSAALALAASAEALSFWAPEGAYWGWVGMAIAAVAIGLAGWSVYQKGVAALLRGKLNINALMAVAVTGAFVIGQWPEAAMVMALYALAELLEARAVDRARNAIEGLLALAPEEALVQNAEGAWSLMPVVQVPLQALVRLKPGERVALDGVVTDGQSSVNQAPVTGESIPVDKSSGDMVFAGTINQSGELTFRVTAAAGNTTLARIIHSVEQAQSKRAPTQKFVDRFAAIYTPAVFAIAIAVAVLTPWLMDLTVLEAVYKALVLLVIACPCALVISTPVTVVSALSAAARRGILIKGGTYLENARLLKAVALDKTGTLTQGQPKLVAWSVWQDTPQAQAEQWAASLASRSDHPVSQAIAAGLNTPAQPVQDFTALPGLGVAGQLEGQALVLANHRLVHERGLCSPALEAALAEHEQQGRTLTLLANDSQVLAYFAVADTIRPTTQAAVAALRALGITPVMLTGDNASTAQAIARQAGIDDARGELLPDAKREAIADMQRRYGPTGMVGDGINDAPALAQADIGFAMGGAGTDTALETADVVIMNDDLQRIAQTVRLSRRTHAVLWQNISLALGIKAVFFVLAVFGTASMWMAVFADMGASLLVVANGMRLLRALPEDAAGAERR